MQSVLHIDADALNTHSALSLMQIVSEICISDEGCSTHAGDAVVATCAGDSEVRVHDVARGGGTDVYR